MRSLEEKKQIKVVKTRSSGCEQQLILETPSKREYFRFQDKRVVEYDLTKMNGNQVRLTNEEKSAGEEFLSSIIQSA
jgi:hypothetical protein